MAEIDDRAIKRARMSPIEDANTFDSNADFVSLGYNGDAESVNIGHDASTGSHRQGTRDRSQRNFDHRNRADRPRTKHLLPGHEPWVLVRTRLGRRFVHNTKTLQSLWRIPRDIQAGVNAYDETAEKKSNAQWAEQELLKMRSRQPAADHTNPTAVERRQRRRSESLQREDEAAMLAELAAEDGDAATAASTDATHANIAPLESRGYLGAASDSEYEYVEVTDSEGEGAASDAEEADATPDNAARHLDHENSEDHAEGAPVEFGEDDIAYQLAMMGESYGLEPEEYGYPGDDGSDEEQPAEDVETAMELSSEEATALFNEMLEEHGISPFTPWDKVIADTSSTSVVLDARYTLLPSSKARKEAWDTWSREQAARIQAQRAAEEKQDPRVAYLSFLSQHANTKLYWPEFKRKFKREPELNDRALQEKDRERLYRELVTKLKLPEAKRKEELHTLLRGLPKNNSHALEMLPSKLLTNVVVYSVPSSTREQLLASYRYRTANM